MSYEETGEVHFTKSSKSNPKKRFFMRKVTISKRAYHLINVQKDRPKSSNYEEYELVREKQIENQSEVIHADTHSKIH